MVSRIFLLISLCLAFSWQVCAQKGYFVLYLKDKKGSWATLQEPELFLSKASLARREKEKVKIDSTDLPISITYLNALRSNPNITVIHTSKWLNAVLIEAETTSLPQLIQAYAFIQQSEQVAYRTAIGNSVKKIEPPTNSFAGRRQTDPVPPLQGNAAPQLNSVRGDALHQKGFRGKDINIAVFDAGFSQYQTSKAFDSLRFHQRIKGTFDLLENNSNVNDDDAHGSLCLSILAGNIPYEYIGTAPEANYYLFRTENATSELPVETFYWLKAAEIADSIGVDIISSSLAYLDFDNSNYNYTYTQRNGNTTLISKAAGLASKKGILVVNSAGNYGAWNNDWRYVACPADVMEVLTIGSINFQQQPSLFSSIGPNGKGQLKPDLVAIGEGAAVLQPGESTTSFANGTSFAAPQIAGLMAALKQAAPEYSNQALVALVKQTASSAQNPNNKIGFGIPNFSAVYDRIMADRVVAKFNNQWVKIAPNPFQPASKIYLVAPKTGLLTLTITNTAGAVIWKHSQNVESSTTYTFSPERFSLSQKGVYFLIASIAEKQQQLSFIVE